MKKREKGFVVKERNVIIGYLTFDPAVQVSKSHKEDEEFDGGKFDT